MTETPEPELPAAQLPEETTEERIARLAAEAVNRARPDLSARLAAAEQGIAELIATLTAAAGPDGNGARLAARLGQVEADLAALAARPLQPHPEQQKQIDDLRLKVAHLERTAN